ncbi:DUF475 domain-containing protein [Frankia sp. CNm7]|uniref:DUF475 domain-containing protein n=1 Tax=Frankia nepalensis TaxID=1836974 RepID=A0A937RW81_9ACTN|nr:DUF475 domain-containing protein [Frankia nepalensis]MBL7497957.1 DUF475 domain-containing protein [Frankia nepalensis]MBL7512185.1 DUF475 domain-containing protein [Frankia nepalensis]MBL7524530.1 DUF475 domain-containing protein [Frankia nepalensis]MBL7632981.1 DUF475 domain-containing protein [Frankia nepalensis]
MHILRIFGWSFAITAVGVALAGVIGGGEAAAIVAILAVLEISLSFDNAVINATILRRMSLVWQRLFLTVGILIAVFGMRLIFPIVVVALTAHLGPIDVIDLAVNSDKVIDGGTYADKLHEAHPAIAAFGGIFLFMIFLDFMFDPERDVQWLRWIEEPLRKIGQLDVVPVVLALAALLVVGETIAGDDSAQVFAAGVAGLATYLAVRGLGEFFESRGIGAEEDEDEDSEGAAAPATAAATTAPAGGGNQLVLATGKAAFFLFLYLEVLDASFSFDGVVGAFAISQNIFIIAAGLGIGAMYIRSITVYLVRRGTLQEYVFLEHGAHYAIGALAVILALTIKWEVPEIITGLVGVGFIGVALLSSIRHRNARRNGAEPDEEEAPEPVGAKS